MKNYVVTGCGSGIGLALTQGLLSRGDRVFGTLRGGRAPVTHEHFTPLTFDVRDDAAIKAAAASVKEPIDALINNAGVTGPRTSTALEMDFDGFADVLDVNTLGPLRVVHAFLPHLRRAPGAKVMTVSSMVGSMNCFVGSSVIAYQASKAAVNKVMQALASDLVNEGIAVVVTHPGWVRTRMGGADGELDPEESAAGLIKIVDKLALETTGRFLNWDGTERPW